MPAGPVLPPPGGLPARIRGAAALAWRAGPANAAVLVAVALVAALEPVALAGLTRQLVDALTAAPVPAGRVYALTGALVGLGCVAALVPLVHRYAEAELGRRLTLLVQDRLFAAVNSLDNLDLFERPGFHDRLRLAQQDGGIAPQQVIGGGLAVLQDTVMLSGFLVALAVIDPRLAALGVAVAVPALVAQLRTARERARVILDLTPAERRELFYRDLQINPQAAKEVRLFGLGRFLHGRMLGELRTVNAGRRTVDRRALVSQSWLALLGTVLGGLALALTAREAVAGRITAGDVTVVLAALAAVTASVGALVAQAADLYEGLLLFGHYDTVIDAAATRARPASVPDVAPLRHAIELRDVWFRYGEDHPWVLRGVNLTIPAGGTTAIVGLNGAGKSTVVKLLCRLYEPTRGTITWDGTDLATMAVDPLRARLSVVFQDFMCYDLSAADNIAVGRVEAVGDRDRIVRAARRAGVDAALRALPRGYDTMLTRLFEAMVPTDTDTDTDTDTGGAAGVVLSGGQWQRVAVARALLRADCDVLFLDEPSAGLDAAAEHEIHRALRAARPGRTSVLISHRLSTVRDADTIVVLADGRVAERGSHGDLMRARAGYAELFDLQAAGYRR